jgi:hypothetical protein
MSTNDLDVAAKCMQKHAQQKRRGWLRRNWRWFVPALLLTVVVVGGGALYWTFFLRVYNLDVCQSAMRTIAADKGLQEALGRPIGNVNWPSRDTLPNARIEESEIDVMWNIEGPKGQAKAHLLAKRRQGKWQTVALEVTPNGGKKVSLQEVGNADDEAPLSPFGGANPEPPKAGGKKPETKAADINIDLPVPPPDAPEGAK